MEQTKVRMSRGKFNGINAVADEQGVIAAAAMDQRGSLRKAIAKAQGSDASDAQVSELLGHSGTAMLHKHYAHLTARSQALRDALGRVR